MVFKKKPHPKIIDQQQLRVTFARLAHTGASIKVRLGSEVLRSRVLAEEQSTIFSAFKLEDVERFHIKTNISLPVVFYHEGKEYYGGMKVVGVGRFDRQEAIRLQIPEALHIRDDFGLTTYHTNPRIEATFTNMFKQFCSGWTVNIGVEGVDLINKESTPIKELLAVDRDCDVAFNLDDLKIYCKATVLYIMEVGDHVVGLKFEGMDARTKGAIEQWIAEKKIEKINRDNAWLRNLMAGKGKQPEEQVERGPVLRDDYKTVLHPGSPKVLLLSRDPNMIGRVEKAIKRKYGVLISKGRYRNVKILLEEYHPDLVLVAETLDTISGFDLVSTITEQHPDAPPMILLGATESLELRSNAIARGAMDYWCVEPFRPLSFFKAIDEAISLVTPMLDDPPQASRELEPDQEAE